MIPVVPKKQPIEVEISVVQESVPVAAHQIKLEKHLIAVLSPLAIQEARGVTEELGTVVDLAVAVPVQSQKGIVGPYAGSLKADTEISLVDLRREPG